MDDEQHQRKVAAARIRLFADQFMVCEGCDSIYRRGGQVEQAGMCPQCHAYRFDRDPERVKATTRLLEARDRTQPVPDDYR